MKNGFRVRIRAVGTNNVPLAIELCFREGGQLEGCRPIPDAPGTFLLEQGSGGIGVVGMRFGSGGGCAASVCTVARRGGAAAGAVGLHHGVHAVRADD